ncbi:haloacid dehalogenase [Hydrococcus rivularis NIES-593]|uniref:Haloacid dehalogenase n=1 Tax=Hydrococcus rivularis NIES-593 TaxID=1921803 RepID=A0A1U7HCW4_9CYAN|nr:HAD family hydrolase [Hydrococcus rivularis]OKH21409.1 haloacid dehalogenase [Hydrococcus rivularis NIES-593]
MLRLITDFDGPIMDVSERYYRVYQFCLEQTKRPEQPVRELSKSKFWELKRTKVPERQIGILSGLDEAQARKFARLRRQTVHTLSYLVYDRPIPSAVETLERLQKQGIDLVVMTMRRVRELEAAFEQYDLRKFFPSDRCYCLSDDYVKTADVEDKPLLMEKALRELPLAADTWMIGDTEADIIAAKTHNIKVVGVLSGIRDRERLEQYQPDHIAKNLSEAVDLVMSAIHAIS